MTIKRNEANEPVFSIEGGLEVTRMDSTMALHQQIAGGKFGDVHFEVLHPIGGVGILVNVGDRDGLKSNTYCIDLKPIVQKILESHEEWQKPEHIARPERKKKGA